MKVIKTIQSTLPNTDGTMPDPVEMKFYEGDSLAQAMMALAMASADVENQDKYFRILSVQLMVEEAH